MVTVPEVPGGFFGIYGAAVDAAGDFWGSQLGMGRLVHVFQDDLSYDIYNMPAPGYGMTVDSDGYVWTCSQSVARFDPETELWMTNPINGSAGCGAIAGEGGLLWVSAFNAGLIGVNRDTLAIAKTCNVASYGVAVDFADRVWAVAYGGQVSRVDTETCQATTYNLGLNAYTYSDMTGYAMANAG
jgi:streptogramin lyase